MEFGMSRRGFLGLAAAGSLLAQETRGGGNPLASPVVSASSARPAILGGTPVRSAPWPAWPVFDAREERHLQDVLASGKWFRGYGDKVAKRRSPIGQLS